MRLPAANKTLCSARTLILVFSVGTAAVAQSSHCDYPDGGSVSCEDGQVAVCKVSGGIGVGECKRPASSARTQNKPGAAVATKATMLGSLIDSYLANDNNFCPGFVTVGTPLSKEEAESEFQERDRIRNNPNDKDAHSQLGLILFQEGRLDEAEREYRRAVQLARPGYDMGIPMFFLGQVLYKQGRYQEAEDMFRRSFDEWRPIGFYCVQTGLARSLASQRKYRQVESVLNELTEPRPDADVLLIFNGYNLLALGNFSEAEVAFRRAREWPSRRGVAKYEGLLVALLKQGKYSEAYSISGATTSSTTEAWTLFQQGLSLLTERKYFDAADKLNQAYRLDSTNTFFITALETANAEERRRIP
jgi:tetratricopeptide (TPR) repeat protein